MRRTVKQTSMPFCVIDRPFVVWSDDIGRDREEFLERLDADFYARTALKLGEALPDEMQEDASNEGDENQSEIAQSRKDIASLSRLLWHHGIETLVMMLGGYIQAPEVIHAYFQKCRTRDTLEIAQGLLTARRPVHNRINDVSFNVENLLRGLHLCAGWPGRDNTLQKFRDALQSMLAAFVSEEQRWEYNSIKHGLRASHGQFALAVGLEEEPGVEAPPEAMHLIGSSRDASFFKVAKPLRNASKEASRVNFKLDNVSVSWSLEKVLCELQILSILISNTISALRIGAGAVPNTVVFKRPADEENWWRYYEGLYAGPVTKCSFGIDIDANGAELRTGDDVFESYRLGAWRW